MKSILEVSKIEQWAAIYYFDSVWACSYGNMGCAEFNGGIQNQEVYSPKVTRLQGKIHIFRLRSSAACAASSPCNFRFFRFFCFCFCFYCFQLFVCFFIVVGFVHVVAAIVNVFAVGEQVAEQFNCKVCHPLRSL